MLLFNIGPCRKATNSINLFHQESLQPGQCLLNSWVRYHKKINGKENDILQTLIAPFLASNQSGKDLVFASVQNPNCSIFSLLYMLGKILSTTSFQKWNSLGKCALLSQSSFLLPKPLQTFPKECLKVIWSENFYWCPLLALLNDADSMKLFWISCFVF